MNWYSGTIPEAVAEAKLHNRIFLVYIEGNDDLSKQMTATYNDPLIVEKLSTNNCVAIKLPANSRSYQQFSEIYPVLVIPSSFFIGRNGIPLEIITGSLEAGEFCSRLNKVFELHAEEYKGTSNVSSSQNLQKQNVPSSETAHSTSERPSSCTVATASTFSTKGKVGTENKNLPTDVTATSEGNASPHCPVPSESRPLVSSNEDVSQSFQASSAESGSDTGTSLEERVERAKALVEQRRMLKELEENEKEKRDEIQRRKVGKALQESQKTKQENELKEWALNRAKEKEEERLAKERVRAQIAQDRAERAARFQQEKARELEALKEKENAALRVEQEKAAKNAAQRSATAHLQFRAPNGSTVTHQFSADATLEDARQFVLQEVRPSCGSFTLCTTFPRRHFTENNYSETLRDLQLAPSATLLILPAVSSVARDGGYFYFLFWTFLTPFLAIWRTVSSWFGGTPVNTVRGSSPPRAEAGRHAAEQQPSTSGTGPNQNRATGPERPVSQQRDQSGFYRQEGNIFRLRGQQSDDDDENNTWNGNSTQQM